MASPSYAILFSAKVSGAASTGGAGDVLIPATAGGDYALATTATRGTRRSTGIALAPYAANGTVEIQQYGQVDATTAALGTGAASWVRVSTGGALERIASPSTGDDVVGWVETDGTFHACFGILTAAMVNPATGSFVAGGDLTGSSSSQTVSKIQTVAVTPPTSGLLVGTTDTQTLTGKTIAGASNTLTVRIANDVTGLGTGVATFLGTPTGANLASALTTAIPVSKTTVATSAMAALTIDWSLSNAFTKTLSAGANTITFSNQLSGQTIVVRLTGAASTVTWPTVKWPGGTVPTQTASGTDVYTFFYDGTSVYGSVVQAMA